MYDDLELEDFCNKQQKSKTTNGSRMRFSYKDCIVAIIGHRKKNERFQAFANIISLLDLFKYEISTYRYFHVVHDDHHRAA
jgi:hypothetical protein